VSDTYGNEFLTVKVDGLDKLQETFKRFPIAVSRRLLKEALISAAQIWRDEMEARAPKLATVKLSENSREVRIPGDLARHIGMKLQAASDIVRGSVQVGPSKRTFWGLFQEIGRRASASGSKVISIFGGKGRKSGGASYMRAQPFVKPAFESKAEAVLNRFVEEGNRIVAEEIQKNV
jgi:HK97 gp10 family phage protein